MKKQKLSGKKRYKESNEKNKTGTKNTKLKISMGWQQQKWRGPRKESVNLETEQQKLCSLENGGKQTEGKSEQSFRTCETIEKDLIFMLLGSNERRKSNWNIAYKVMRLKLMLGFLLKMGIITKWKKDFKIPWGNGDELQTSQAK